MHFELWQLVACWHHHKHALSRCNKVQGCFYFLVQSLRSLPSFYGVALEERANCSGGAFLDLSEL
jgi:hypothetical protein